MTFSILKQEREKLGITLKEISGALGMSLQSVLELEASEVSGGITIADLSSYAEALGYTFEYRLVRSSESAKGEPSKNIVNGTLSPRRRKQRKINERNFRLANAARHDLTIGASCRVDGPKLKLICSNGVKLGISPIEYTILRLLSIKPGDDGVTYDELRKEIWDELDVDSLSSLRVTVARLRKKLMNASCVDVEIKTVKERGLALTRVDIDHDLHNAKDIVIGDTCILSGSELILANRKGIRIRLPKSDHRILYRLANSPSCESSFSDLARSIGVNPDASGVSLIRASVHRLRKRLLECECWDIEIRSLKGLGYRLSKLAGR